MKIKLDTVLYSLENEPLINEDKEITLGIVCINALLISDVQEKDADEKIKRYCLAMQICDKKEIEVSVEEIVLIKKCINRAYAQPLIVGQAYDLLENRDNKEKLS